MIKQHGRKYTMTMIGIGCTVGLTVLGFALAALVPEIAGAVGNVLPIAIGAIAAMVATFITGNSAISFAVAKQDISQTQTSRQIIERRDNEQGIDPTP